MENRCAGLQLDRPTAGTGLLGESFMPPAPIRELRDLTRHRKTIVQERSQTINRLDEILGNADIKLASVATGVLGVSGRAMLEALVGGTTDPDALADLARGDLREKLPALNQTISPASAFVVALDLGTCRLLGRGQRSDDAAGRS